jgi:hypothetical protein
MCFFKGLLLVISRRVTFIKQDQDRLLEIEDGLKFRVFGIVSIDGLLAGFPAAERC